MPSKLSSRDFGGDNSSGKSLIVLLKHYQKRDKTNADKIEATNNTHMHTMTNRNTHTDTNRDTHTYKHRIIKILKLNKIYIKQIQYK